MSLALITKGKLWPQGTVIREQVNEITINVSEPSIEINVTDDDSDILLGVIDVDEINMSISDEVIIVDVEEMDDIDFNIFC